MGVKLGPKLELSFWAIGYMVLAVALLIFNISWISASLNGILLGRMERTTFNSEIGAPTKDHLDSIESLIKEPGLEAKKREILTARAARLSYNLKIVDQARKHYDDLVKSSNPDVAARAEISLVAIDLEQAPTDPAKPELKIGAIEFALKQLDALAVKYPNSTDVKAAQGALYMNFFTGTDPTPWVAKARDLLKAVKSPAAAPGNIESRRNLLLLELAVRNFDEIPTTEDEKNLANLRGEAKKIAPYISDVKKTSQVLFLEKYYAAIKDNTVGPLVLNETATLTSLPAEEYAQLVNTVVNGVVPTLSGPNAKNNLKIMQNAYKVSLKGPGSKVELSYNNGAAISVRYAAIQDQLLEETLTRLKNQGEALPVPFGSGEKILPEIATIVAEEDRCLGEAAALLKAGIDEAGLRNESKRIWAQHLVEIHLWRAALAAASNRTMHLNAALTAVVIWHDLDPKNLDMMLATAKIYELMGKNAERTKALAEAIAAGAKVANAGPETNDFRFVTVYPGNPLQVGTTDFQVRGQPVLVGATFQVQGYTETVDGNTVKLLLNGKGTPISCQDGVAYVLIKPDQLTSQNTVELKMALSPQLTKSTTSSFRFKAK